MQDGSNVLNDKRDLWLFEYQAIWLQKAIAFNGFVALWSRRMHFTRVHLHVPCCEEVSCQRGELRYGYVLK